MQWVPLALKLWDPKPTPPKKNNTTRCLCRWHIRWTPERPGIGFRDPPKPYTVVILTVLLGWGASQVIVTPAKKIPAPISFREAAFASGVQRYWLEPAYLPICLNSAAQIRTLSSKHHLILFKTYLVLFCSNTNFVCLFKDTKSHPKKSHPHTRELKTLSEVGLSLEVNAEGWHIFQRGMLAKSSNIHAKSHVTLYHICPATN